MRYFIDSAFHACPWVWVRPCTHVWRPEEAVRYAPLLLFTLYFEKVSRTKPKAHHFHKTVAGQQASRVCPLLPMWATYKAFHVIIRGLDSGPLAHRAGSLTHGAISPSYLRLGLSVESCQQESAHPVGAVHPADSFLRCAQMPCPITDFLCC